MVTGGQTKLKLLRDYLVLVFAGMLYAITLKYFVFPAKVILTGFEGIAVSISYSANLEWLFVALYVFFQGCLLLFGFIKVSRRFATRTLLVVATVALLLPHLPLLRLANPEPSNERIMLVIFGGLLAGIAKAISLRSMGSTGDEDILGAFFAMKYLKPVGSISVIAAVVSTTFGLCMMIFFDGFGPEHAINTLMYTCIFIFMSATTLNAFYRKFRLSLVVIITQRPEKVVEAITASYPHRTYTVQESKGGHSGQPFTMMRMVATHEEMPDIVRAIRDIERTFFFYHDIEGISGNYYIKPIG